MSQLTWKYGGGLVPQPAPEETAAAGKTKSKPGAAPAEAAVEPVAETVAEAKPEETAGTAEAGRGE